MQSRPSFFPSHPIFIHPNKKVPQQPTGCCSEVNVLPTQTIEVIVLPTQTMNFEEKIHPNYPYIYIV